MHLGEVETLTGCLAWMVILRSQTGDPTDIRDRQFIRMVTGGVKEDLTSIGGGGGGG